MALVIVSSRGGSTDLRTDVRAGSHNFVCDEPPGSGGKDLGPSPYDLLVGALGSCTAMTVEIYALRMGWPLERVVVKLRHDRLHSKDSSNPRDGFLDRIEREIALEGRLTDDQKAKLIEVANSCPVNRALSSSVNVETRLAA